MGHNLKGDIMSSIEERIQKHEKLLVKAEERYQKHNALRLLWDEKVAYYKQAIDTLKAKQEKKVD